MESLLDNYLANTPKEDQKSERVAFLASLEYLRQKHPRVAQTLTNELIDQRKHLKMIASENYSSLAVQMAMGTWMTDKYAEGVPKHRFYAGCEQVDEVEAYAVDLLKQIFNKLANSGILVRQMDVYSIKNSLRVTIGNSKENKKFISILRKIFNV